MAGNWSSMGAPRSRFCEDKEETRNPSKDTHTGEAKARRMDGWMDEGGDGYRKPTCERKWNLGGDRKCYPSSSISAGKAPPIPTGNREKPLNPRASGVTMDAWCDDSAHVAATQN